VISLAGIWLGLIVRQWVLTGRISKLNFNKLAIDLKRGLPD
jgi:hypothetical protein